MLAEGHVPQALLLEATPWVTVPALGSATCTPAPRGAPGSLPLGEAGLGQKQP